jgi:hypothetical protein
MAGVLLIVAAECISCARGKQLLGFGSIQGLSPLISEPASGSCPPDFCGRGLVQTSAFFCHQCQQFMSSKVTSSVHAPVQPIEVLVKRFSYVHIDIVGPLPAASSGLLHLFTIVDRSTRWTEAIPFKGTSAVDCVEGFFTGWVSRLVVASKVTSDRGVQFTSVV